MTSEMQAEWCVYIITVGEKDYIGVAKDYNTRIKEHAEAAYCNNSSIKVHQAIRESPSGFSAKIIFHGTEQECYDVEKALRPNANMELNTTQGGRKEEIEGIAPSQNTYEVKDVRLERLYSDFRFDNTVIKTDRGDYIDYDNRYKQWKSFEGRLVSARLTGQVARGGWKWIELHHVIKTTPKKSDDYENPKTRCSFLRSLLTKIGKWIKLNR